MIFVSILAIIGVIVAVNGFLAEELIDTVFLLCFGALILIISYSLIPQDNESSTKLEIINSFNQVQEYSTLERN